jgi:hypothetical protein
MQSAQSALDVDTLVKRVAEAVKGRLDSYG